MRGAEAAGCQAFQAESRSLASRGLAVGTGLIALGTAKGIVPLSINGVIFSTQANL
jgi:hypothetical protein